MVVFVVSVNQKIGILVLFVVLYHTLEKPAFCLTYVVRIALLIWTFCVVDDVVLMFFLCLIFDGEFGKFYGTAKVHKVKPEEQDKIGKLPLRPIISNIGTATHKTAQYLCNLLTPLSNSDFTVLNTKDFVDNIKNTKAPVGYVAISFDVVSLFTNVPLRDTIDIILKKVYDCLLYTSPSPRDRG